MFTYNKYLYYYNYYMVYFQSSIECFYDEPGGIVYLHLTGSFDSHSITQNIDELSTEIEEKVRTLLNLTFII